MESPKFTPLQQEKLNQFVHATDRANNVEQALLNEEVMYPPYDKSKPLGGEFVQTERSVAFGIYAQYLSTEPVLKELADQYTEAMKARYDVEDTLELDHVRAFLGTLENPS